MSSDSDYRPEEDFFGEQDTVLSSKVQRAKLPFLSFLPRCDPALIPPLSLILLPAKQAQSPMGCENITEQSLIFLFCSRATEGRKKPRCNAEQNRTEQNRTEQIRIEISYHSLTHSLVRSSYYFCFCWSLFLFCLFLLYITKFTPTKPKVMKMTTTSQAPPTSMSMCSKE